MEVSRSTSYPTDATAQVSAPTANRGETGSVAAEPSAAPAKDHATISQAAQDKLQAEKSGTTATGPSTAAPNTTKPASNTTTEANQGKAPSETKKLAYGALGLERPTAANGDTAPDGYTYGRWIAAAVTVAAVVSILV